MAGVKVDPPPVNMSIVDLNTGRPTRPFVEFIHRLWQRTGGEQDAIDVLDSTNAYPFFRPAGPADPEDRQPSFVMQQTGASQGAIDEAVSNLAALVSAKSPHSDLTEAVKSFRSLTLVSMSRSTSEAGELRNETAAIQSKLNQYLPKSDNLASVASASAAFKNIKQAATTTTTGVVEKATTAEAEAGTADKYPDAAAIKVERDKRLLKTANLSDVANVATAFTNIKQAATTTATGVVEKATTAEAKAGTADKYPDAAGVHDAIEYKTLGSAAQTWQEVSTSRSADVTYTNSTSRPIAVVVGGYSNSHTTIGFIIDGMLIEKYTFLGSAGRSFSTSTHIIPANSTYSVILGSGVMVDWFELR